MRALIQHPALQTDVSASANAMTDTHLDSEKPTECLVDRLQSRLIHLPES